MGKVVFVVVSAKGSAVLQRAGPLRFNVKILLDGPRPRHKSLERRSILLQ
jgi:hypothetical protein